MEIIQTSEFPEILTNLEVLYILSKRIESRRQQQEKEESVAALWNHSHHVNGTVTTTTTSTTSPATRNLHRMTPMVKPKIHKKLQHLNFIEDKVYQYLKTTVPSENDSVSLAHMSQTMTWFVSTLQKKRGGSMETTSKDKDSVPGFGLTKTEVLQIVNWMPTELVELHLIINNLDHRMDHDEQQRLLEFIKNQRRHHVHQL
jgi:hypothetical protein